MDARLAVHARSHRPEVSAWLAVLAVLALAAPAVAAPKGGPAKVAFDRGVAAYQKGDFAAASEALGTSFKLEPDAETLFAWAQAERQLDHCDRAIELFEKLLTFDLPAENKKVIVGKIEECRALLPPKPAKQPEKQPEQPPEPQPERPPEAQPEPPLAGGTAPVSADRPPSGPEGSPWWKDPLGGALVAGGVVGLGVGSYYLVEAKKEEDASRQRDSDFKDHDERAQRYSKIGVASLVVGGALVAGGVVRYMTRRGGERGKERTAVTGWLSPDGGGITAIGRF
jgi:tetratricopeptide (TPR) repeat protein